MEDEEEINIKNYQSIDAFKSLNLMNYCINNKEMDLYIPDATYLETIERFFWLKVNYNRHLFENLLLNNI